MMKITIFGAGMTGLFCGLKLSKNNKVILIEKENNVGGMSTSFKYDGFMFDYGGHKIFSIIPGIVDEFKEVLGDELEKKKTRKAMRLMDDYFDLPLKTSQLLQVSPILGMKSLFGFLSTFFRKKNDISYEDYFINRFGAVMYNLVFRDYALKVWGDPKKLSEELARRRVPVKDMTSLIKNMFKQEKSVNADYFYYPKYGMESLCTILENKIKNNNGNVFLNSTPLSVNIIDNKVQSFTFRINKSKRIQTMKTNFLISTIPLKDLLFILEPKPPENILRATTNLRYRSLVLLCLIVKKPTVLDYGWIFFPEKKYIFNRVSEMKSYSLQSSPKDKSSLLVEITCDFGDPIWKSTDKGVFDRVISDLEKIEVLKREDVEYYFTKKVNKAYPVYSLNFRKHLKTILNYLSNIENLITLGRQGLFNYNNMDHCVDMAIKVTNHITEGKSKKEWKKMLKHFDNYRIID